VDSTTTSQPGPVLALDTATAQAGIAVGGDGRVSCLSWDAGRSHTVHLLDQVHRLLGLHGVAAADLRAVAVASGPGSFTGLRVAMSLAKGFAIALDLPLLGVPTLEAAALPFLDGRRTVVAVAPAGRGRFAWAPFGGDNARPLPLAAARNGDRDEVLAALADAGAPVVVGEFDDGTAAAFAGVAGAFVPPAPLRLRQPAALLELALRRLRRGDLDDAVSLAPAYLAR
jgi:tRNA threonylcarbamoyladenosine biosynthesis protein TsaB